MISVAPARRIGATYGAGSPKDSITAWGPYSSSPAPPCRYRPPRSENRCPTSCRCRRRSALRGPANPVPAAGAQRSESAARQTAAASAPPAEPPMGANVIGYATPNSLVNAVDNAMTALPAHHRSNRAPPITLASGSGPVWFHAPPAGDGTDGRDTSGRVRSRSADSRAHLSRAATLRAPRSAFERMPSPSQARVRQGAYLASVNVTGRSRSGGR